MADDALWRRRLLAFTAVRLVGLAIFLLGIAIAFSSVVREGGWPQFGAIVAILGAIDAVFAPRIHKRAWDRQDQQE